MNQLLLDNKPWNYIRFGIGILSLIAGLSFILSRIGNLSRLDYLLAFGFILTGIVHITNDFGMQKTFIRKYDNSLIVKWINKIKTQEIEYTQIESIKLRRQDILINQQNNKILKLSLLTFRTEQKKMIYAFFINLAKDHNLNLVKHFS